MAEGRRSRPARVFISSAQGGMAPYRAAAIDVVRRLGMIAVCMEEFSPERPPPAEVCRREVLGSNVFVLLLGYRYGSRPAGFEASYTELEYHWAADRKSIEVLPFIVDQDFAWPPRDIDRGADEEALEALIEEVKSRHTARLFGDLNKFREDLLIALRPFEVPDESESRGKRESPSARRRVPARPTLHAVPPYVGSAPFTGRDEQLDLLDVWAASTDPVMVVEAIGGTGKSALTWQWATERAEAAIEGLAGRVWWSFYDGSASMTRFLHEVLAYTTDRRWGEIRRLSYTDLSAAVLAALRERPYLLVLDGFERLLAAYHRFDPSKLRDDEVAVSKRSLIEPQAHEVLRALTAAAPSKVLISTRLMPDALEGRFGQRMPGVAHVRLPGLTDADTLMLLFRLGVDGSQDEIKVFFRRLDNHPLLIGVVAGLVRDYRPQPGSFDRWLADPTAGAAFALPELDLTQRRTHILAAALDGLQSGNRLLLGWISEFAGAVDWATIEAVNPFLPDPPDPVMPDYVEARDFEQTDAAARAAIEAARTAWRSSEPVIRAKALLDLALKDLEDRGLLWWDRASNTYDLHPIVRAVAHEMLDEGNRVRANERIAAHFQTLPGEAVRTVNSVEELGRPITLYRALVGAQLPSYAHDVWRRSLIEPILLRLGATRTAIELLTPLAPHVNYARTELGVALYQAGRYREALAQEVTALTEEMQHGWTDNAIVNLENAADYQVALGRHADAVRYLEFMEEILGPPQTARTVRYRAVLAAIHGQVEEAIALFGKAAELGPNDGAIWFESDLRYWPLYLAFRSGDSLSEERLDAADAEADAWLERRNLKRLRKDLLIRRGDLRHALDASEECDRMERDSGIETAPAATAYLLAALGRTAEAKLAVEEALVRLPRIEEESRPHYDLARVLRELGRTPEAIVHAREAYRQAWGDGPPYCHHWNVLDAEALLAELGEPLPELPTLDTSAHQVPLEREIRAFIANEREEG